jgi:hypothetical protein
MDNVKQQVVDRLKQANNILVTVKNSPSIDLLSSCLALSLLLDKLDKHATAVFSGEVPSAMEFLKPEETIEQTPNSLRDFIISLDKSKADKLRYKVEDKVVRIFITPYKSSLSQDDLEFSQGDLNVDLVVALGVHEQNELDEAVVAHGRILHDAGIISINNTANGSLGSLNWQDTNASSVAEMIADLSHSFGEGMLDEQVATALLTGIVAETARFSNDKTTPQTMRLAGELMAAGANQQLVANELKNDTAAVPHDATEPKEAGHDDTLHIDHPEEPVGEAEATPIEEPTEKPADTDSGEAKPESGVAEEEPQPDNQRQILPMPDPGSVGQTHDATSADSVFAGAYAEEDDAPAGRSYLIDQPAAGQTQPGGDIEATPNPFAPPATPLLTHNDSPLMPSSSASTTDTPPPTVPQFDPAAFGASDTPAAAVPPTDNPVAAPTTDTPVPTMPAPAEPAQNDQTLADIEKSAGSTHADEPASVAPTGPQQGDTIVDARQQVLDALRQGPQPLETPAAFNAHPLGEPLHDEPASAPTEPAKPMAIEVDDQGNLKSVPAESASSAPDAMDMPLPPVAPMSSPAPDQPMSQPGVPAQAPPPVPPPMTPMPPNFTPPAQ